jgi:hypothetical protein
VSFLRPFVALSLLLALTGVALADTGGSKSFIARPKIGAARLSLPAQVTWDVSPAATSGHLVALTLTIDATSVLRDIKALSAAALDKSKPCGDLMHVNDASAKLMGPTTLAYNLSFHYAKRICAPNNMSLDIPADVSCKSIIALSGAGTRINVDIRGASHDPCTIDGAEGGGMAGFAAKKVFKRHVLELTDQLPPEFAGVAINLKTIAFEPPAPRLRLTGEAIMTDQQFAAFTARLNATASASRGPKNR